ncbi:MAG TPA: ABC transporter permease [Acidimicrobiales bacterium]|nr:ABC transporter permease [Acidimicrobiales bacterium]
MSDVGMARRQVVAEQKSFWRNPAAAGFTIVFPLMLLIVFASINTDSRIASLGNIRFIEYYVPGILAYAVIAACFMSLAMNLTRQRDEGILKRKRATPLPAWALIAGLVGSSIVVAFVLAAVTIALSMVLYGDKAPAHVGWLLVVLVLGAMTFASLGVAITAAIPNADAAPAIVNLVVLPLVFLAGTFFPITSQTLTRVSNVFPVRPFEQALFAAFDPRGVSSHPPARDLLTLALWAVGGVVLAARTFRWERRSG